MVQSIHVALVIEILSLRSMKKCFQKWLLYEDLANFGYGKKMEKK
jgi:hypothetical protein